ncbi:restriction endonuclease subunit S [Corynebacterium casei]|uniref:restriction endonuclease subunit S n=1 Tax=Corynebacterium casei TaxID=160386 RepID=UPI003FD57F98
MNRPVRELSLKYYADINPSTDEFKTMPEGEQVAFLPLENIWAFGTADYSRSRLWKKSETSYTQFRRGDVLVPKVTPTVFHGRSMVAEPKTEVGLATSEVHVLRPKDGVDRRWIAYNVLSSQFLDRARGNVYGVGGLQRISAGYLGDYKVLETDIASQRRIADYLDRETAEIDAAVADLDRYLELLEKRKKTLAVKHIFPYGFPQNLLSASDYLALGYQSVQRIASFAKLRKKRNNDPNADYLSLLRGRGVIPYEEKGNVGNKKPQDLTTSFMVEKGDYLVNSMNFGIGSFGRSSYSGVASAAYLIFCINEELVNPDFLQFVFANDDLRAQAQNLGNGILEHRKSINWDRFRAIYVPMPQRGKQDAIVDVLSRETSELQSLIVESTKLRDLLLKRRSVLITEVVTGKKQV